MSASSSQSRPLEVPSALLTPAAYPVMQFVRRNRESASIGAGVGVFLLVLSASRRRDTAAVLRALFLGVIVGVGVRNLGELNDLVADTLLPQ